MGNRLMLLFLPAAVFAGANATDEVVDQLGAASTIVATMASVDRNPYMIEPVTPADRPCRHCPSPS